MSAPAPEPPPITPEDVAAVADRLVPAALRYLDEYPLASQTYDVHYTAFALLLSQYADRQSRYCGDDRLPTRAWRELQHEFTKPQPPFPAYDTGFMIWELFDCFRAAEGVLSPSQLERFRALFRPAGECLLEAGLWDFESDDRINPALLRATDLAVCGWALDDDRMRGESWAQAAAIFARCDENDVPSEVSPSYYTHMMYWIAQACEIESRPDLLRLLAGLSRLLPMLIYEPTLELMGPDCRDQWKTPCRHNVDTLVPALRAAAVLLQDEGSEWLSRALFREWVKDARFDRGVHSPRAPRYVGCERYDIGWGPSLGPGPRKDTADSPRLVTVMTMRAGQMLCGLKRWLGQEIAATQPIVPDEYCSSRLYLRRYRNGADVAALANLIQPLSYMTPTFGLQGIELWSDDRFFWFNLCAFRPTMFSENGEALTVPQAPHPETLLRKTQDSAADCIVHGAAKYADHLLSLTKIDCSQELVPGIVSWAGLLLMDDRTGEVVFGRSGEIGRGRVLEEQSDCDWILYPCDEKRRFGFGLLALETTGRSHRLSNFSGDWCVLGLSQSEEPIQGLEAFAVVAIGPWEGTPEEYAAWLKGWQVTSAHDRCVLLAPDGRRMELPYPSVP
jgi:hypothetical protein